MDAWFLYEKISTHTNLNTVWYTKKNTRKSGKIILTIIRINNTEKKFPKS